MNAFPIPSRTILSPLTSRNSALSVRISLRHFQIAARELSHQLMHVVGANDTRSPNSPAMAEKYAHTEVQFEHPAKGKNHCSQCVHWTGSGCRIVKPPVKAGDWCNKFESRRIEAKEY